MYEVQAHAGTQFIQVSNAFATPYQYQGLGWNGGFLFGIQNKWNKQLKIAMAFASASSDDGGRLFETNHFDFRGIHISSNVSRPVINTGKLTLAIGFMLAIETLWMDFEVENVVRPVQLNHEQRFTFIELGASIANTYQLFPTLELKIGLEVLPVGLVSFPSPTNPDLNLDNDLRVVGMPDNHSFSIMGGLEYTLTKRWSASYSSRYQSRRSFNSYELTFTNWLNSIGVIHRWQ